MIPGIVAGRAVEAMPPLVTWADAISADSPYLWWRLGEASGTAAADASGNSRPGTYNGTATTDYDLGETGLVGDANNAIEIKTAIGYVRSNSQFAIGDSGAAATLVVAIKINNGAGAGGIMTKYSGTNPGNSGGSRDPWLYVDSSGYLRVGFWTGATTTITSSMQVNDGVARLIHVRIGTNGTEGVELYVNGALDGSVAAAPASTFNGYISIGRNNGTGWPGTSGAAAALGIYDEVVVFNSRLSPTRILAHAEAAGYA